MSQPGNPGWQPPQQQRPTPVPQPVYPPANYPPANYPPANYPPGNYPQPVQPMAYPTAVPGQPIPVQAYPQQVPGYAPGQMAYPQQYGQGAVPGYPAATPIPIASQPSYAQPSYAAPTYATPQPVIPQSAYAAPVPVPATPIPIPNPNTPRPVSVTPQPVVPANANVAPIPVSKAPSPTPVTKPNQPNRPVPVSKQPIPVSGSIEKPLIRENADPDAEEEKNKLDETKIAKLSSPWLVSFIVHVVIIIVMAFIYVVTRGDNNTFVELEAVYAEEIGEQLENAVLDMGLEDPLTTDAAMAEGPVEVADPLAAPVQLVDLVPSTVGITSSDISAPTIGLALTGREAGAKKALLAAYGGTATTEAAVKLGLEWLAKNQRSDGLWSLAGPYSDGVSDSNDNVVSATAMALLAFQGAGHTTKDGDFKKVVNKGWEALLKLQDRDGNFVQDPGFNDHFYAQGQATIAICELYGMTKESRYASHAKLAIDYAVKTQAPSGGWRYRPNEDSDTSVTGWFVMALQSAKMGGLEVPKPTFDKISTWLDRVASEDKARYRYQPGRDPDEVMTAEALLCRQYLGWDHKDPALNSGVDYVVAHPLDYADQNVYYWYYATQVTHHMGGAHWEKWNNVMRQAVPTHQEKSGKEKGSWAPGGDRWGHAGGRLYTTCLSIYMLEVYYRHMPLYTGHAITQTN